MAVKLESTIKRFIGLSTDTKPIWEDETNERLLPAGSSFLESDTGKIFRFNGAGWTHYEPIDAQESYLSAIHTQLAATHRLLAVAFNLQPEEFY